AQHFTDGHNYKEVARLLGLAPATVRSYIQIIYSKLKVADKAQLAAQLVKAG
ncbi:MAG: response regulator transcription factor, partial [Burkholderiales bacterium]|nr:response regulator transcription factor [Burkholderiales bacterium]